MSALKKIFNEHIFHCRIENIDKDKNIVIVHCLGMDAPIKFKLTDLMSDISILSQLSPQHASWAGYYYGQSYRDLLNENKCTIPVELKLFETSRRYKIIALGRNKKISYLDKNTGLIETRSLLSVLTTEELIMNFDAMDGCYMGFLAGIDSI